MKKNKKILVGFLSITFVILFSQVAFPQDWDRLVNLRGWWKFSIGDNSNWANTSYQDDDWEEIRVPSSWEDEGFHGYNGYAWYRKHFTIHGEIPSSIVYLLLGTIDDVDQTYINGHLVGSSGSFPPDYQTAYYSWRKYPVPGKYLNRNGDNVIAVRIYDSELQGGIIKGNIGLYISDYVIADIDLEGQWKFRTGDNKVWKENNFNDKDWDNIFVPGYWESQGYYNYDGYAWYRKTFKAPSELKNKKLVLLMGKIDDLDEVYVNGKLVGSTGTMYDDPSKNKHGQEYSQFRGYYLPDDLIKINDDNVIAVRVFDGWRDGGIYEGPVGLVTQEIYTKFWREMRNKGEKRNIFEILFE